MCIRDRYEEIAYWERYTIALNTIDEVCRTLGTTLPLSEARELAHLIAKNLPAINRRRCRDRRWIRNFVIAYLRIRYGVPAYIVRRVYGHSIEVGVYRNIKILQKILNEHDTP